MTPADKGRAGGVALIHVLPGICQRLGLGRQQQQNRECLSVTKAGSASGELPARMPCRPLSGCSSGAGRQDRDKGQHQRRRQAFVHACVVLAVHDGRGFFTDSA